MGTIGLETAFAALYTELVLAGELELVTVIERMTAGAALYDLRTPRIAVGEEANLCLVDLDTTWEVGADGYVSLVGQLGVPRAGPPRTGAPDARRRCGGLSPPDAGARRAGPLERRCRPGAGAYGA